MTATRRSWMELWLGCVVSSDPRLWSKWGCEELGSLVRRGARAADRAGDGHQWLGHGRRSGVDSGKQEKRRENSLMVSSPPRGSRQLVLGRRGGGEVAERRLRRT